MEIKGAGGLCRAEHLTMIKVFHGINEYPDAVLSGDVPSGPSAVTLGKFDGVHLGHQKLLKEILTRQKEGVTGIMFAIDYGSRYLLSERERAEFVSSFGIDQLIECPFSKELMMTSPEDFVKKVLIETLHARFVAVGTDFRFGFRRAGNAQTLVGFQDRYGFETAVIEKERLFGEEISSTRARAAVENGDMDVANALLGRPYPVWGEVVHGRKLGRTIGIPTANVIPQSGKILPPDGVYASVTVLEDGRTVMGVTNIGKNPTIASDNVRNAETNLFDFNEDLYGSFIRTGLVRRLRGEMKFSSVEELSGQMQRDKEESRRVLKDKTGAV